MDKFLVLVKTRQCKVKGGQVFACRTGRKQAAPQAHVTNFFYSCHFLLIALHRGAQIGACSSLPCGDVAVVSNTAPQAHGTLLFFFFENLVVLV